MRGEAVSASDDRLLEVTLTLDTNAYAQNDILAATQEITNAIPAGCRAVLYSIVLFDYAKNDAALQLWFLNAATSIGTENAAENAADAVSTDVFTIVPLAATDYTDLANWSIATRNSSDKGMGVLMRLEDDDSSLYIGAKITDASAKTYAASDLRLKIGLLVSR